MKQLSMRRRARYLLVLGLVFGLVATACGGGDDTGSGEGGDTTESTAAAGSGEQSDADPVPGGDLVIAIQAETDGWDITKNNWAVEGHFVGQTFYDTLAMFDENGDPQPYLAEDLVPNDDFTVWDIVLREGVTFHNGTQLDAAAVKANLDAVKASGLIGPVFSYVETFEVVDESTVRATMSAPWATFPVALTTQGGYVMEPSTINTDEGARSPVGTGPYVFDRWVPDSFLRVTKNADYWQAGKPHLDSVEFRPIPEPDQLLNSTLANDFDMATSSSVNNIGGLQAAAEAGQIQIVEDGGIGEEGFFMLNLDVAPTDDVRVRRAMAHAINLDAYAQAVDKGVRETARSPFAPSLPWYSQEAVDAYPVYDPEAAEALIAEYEDEVGPVQIAMSETPGQEEETGFLAESWQAVGIDVEVVIEEQGVHIVNGLSGDFQATGWRLFGNPDPDGEYVWWDIDNANPVGEIALNFARLRSEELQAALDAGRATTDFDERKAAYDDAQLIINELVPYIWESHTLWVFAGQNDVRNMAFYELPNGGNGLGVYAGFPGATKLTDIWLEQ